jgi:ABC-type antimicrobial peptide transport system permease subunit
VLALGIGALTTWPPWTNAVLYNPWPHVAAPRELRFVDSTVLGNQGYSVHYDQYRFVRESGRSWNDTIAFAKTSVSLVDAGVQPQALSIGIVSSNYFQFLGIQPQSGRLFLPGANDRSYGSNDEIVLSDALWRSQFDANRSIVGRAIAVNGRPYTVVGVAPPDFAGIFGGVAEAAWIPLSSLRDLSADSGPDPLFSYGLQVALRLRPGVNDRTAAAELHTLANTFALQHHPGSALARWDRDLNLRDAAHFSRGLFGTIGDQLPVLLGASVLLMVLVCINIASLLSQHAARRRREVAIRTALGATPTRIAAQVLVEPVLWQDGRQVPGWRAASTCYCQTSESHWLSIYRVTAGFFSSSPLSAS